MNLDHQSARRYRTPAALRAAPDARLTAAAAAHAVDVGRLRRQVAFERLLVRLVTPTADTAGRWVLKGGQALELRLDGKFRLTRGLDLATTDAVVDGAEAHRHLVAATAQDPQADGFSFSIVSPRSLAVDRSGRLGWRFPVDASLAGSVFVKVRLDVPSGLGARLCRASRKSGPGGRDSGDRAGLDSGGLAGVRRSGWLKWA